MRELITLDSVQGDLNITDEDYSYNPILTAALDDYIGDFDQAKFNEIVLWKVNRFPSVDDITMSLINQIRKTDVSIDPELTANILERLLNKRVCRGFQLAMASTVLRFKNPHIYQILDQRVYRFIYGVTFEEPRPITEKISLYLEYLRVLEEKCIEHGIPFEVADRWLYLADKRFNKSIRLKNY